MEGEATVEAVEGTLMVEIEAVDMIHPLIKVLEIPTRMQARKNLELVFLYLLNLNKNLFNTNCSIFKGFGSGFAKNAEGAGNFSSNAGGNNLGAGISLPPNKKPFNNINCFGFKGFGGGFAKNSNNQQDNENGYQDFGPRRAPYNRGRQVSSGNDGNDEQSSRREAQFQFQDKNRDRPPRRVLSMQFYDNFSVIIGHFSADEEREREASFIPHHRTVEEIFGEDQSFAANYATIREGSPSNLFDFVSNFALHFRR
jgi:hypothetical protein